ncbi:MAG: ATPase [Verrucomicrobia bacterium]|nr:MAG: ATPase [Verrucomicrobiota bacterium]
MAEELKHLIEQIQKEGVEKADEQANTIISQAKEKAATIVAQAEEKAYESLLKAKNESEAFAERSVKTLEQAARDLLITIGQGCEKVIAEVLGREVDKALSGDLLQKMVASVVEQGGGDIELSVSENDKVALATYCAELAKKSGQEIELVSDSEILSGFKVGFKGKNVYLDYTGEAVANALAAFLRPELAKTVSAVAREQVSK